MFDVCLFLVVICIYLFVNNVMCVCKGGGGGMGFWFEVLDFYCVVFFFSVYLFFFFMEINIGYIFLDFIIIYYRVGVVGI